MQGRTERRRRSFLFRWALALVCLLGLVLAGMWMPRSGPAESNGEPEVEVVFAGDIMLDTLPGEAVARGEDPCAAFADVLDAADLAVGNLECVVATTGAPVEKAWTFRAHPRVLPMLARHFGAVSLANNHTGDYGPEAFRQQLTLLRKQGLSYFGGGRDLNEAHLPLIVERKGLRIALLGYNEYHPRSFEAGPDRPGVAWSVDEQVVADLRAARTQYHADPVIPYMHWGWEEYPADDRQQQLARLMIDNGADVVVGSHPHMLQGVETYRGKLIVYSVGNFVFDGFKTEETRTGWLLRLTLQRNGLVAWDTKVVRLDERGLPHPAANIASPFGRIDAMIQWRTNGH